METFENLEEFRKFYPKLADELLEKFGEGEWINEQLFYYKDLSDYAKYELTDGWYAEVLSEKDWRGAPNLIDHIDLETLGNALATSWDNGSYFLTHRKEVIETPCGWSI